MTLPTIILLERHWDTQPKLTLAQALPQLLTRGYTHLGFECPSDESESEIILGLNSTIDFIQKRLQEALARLNSRKIRHSDLTRMDYSDLKTLLLNYVSSGYSAEMALWFRELPGHLEKLSLIMQAKALNIQLCGLDLPGDKLKRIRGHEARFNMPTREAAIISMNEERTESFITNIELLRRQDKNLVFVVGGWHYATLFDALTKNNQLENVIFFRPYEATSIGKRFNDQILPQMPDTCTLIEQKITSSIDMDEAIRRLDLSIDEKYTPIPPTQTTSILNYKTGLNFTAYRRPNNWVDCHHLVEPSPTIDELVVLNRLIHLQIPARISFFKGQISLYIPSINNTEIGNNIMKL